MNEKNEKMEALQKAKEKWVRIGVSIHNTETHPCALCDLFGYECEGCPLKDLDDEDNEVPGNCCVEWNEVQVAVTKMICRIEQEIDAAAMGK